MCNHSVVNTVLIVDYVMEMTTDKSYKSMAYMDHLSIDQLSQSNKHKHNC